ncbi:ImmA/IrrE family metallo-endopeptidase [Paenibacillus sp. SGZ-1009]|uniref:ImmA/IrrE family metallo-endopeptidase n=1 Tax=Paenibacillus campi TaxID=3106031 RepID=UPI002AFE192D|nr:ImmA/IrrE family metallo-endopeptidase [Paenibacillus sp. SGZ-1009]
MDRKRQAEVIAEGLAADFLEETANAPIFIGSYIERILANKAKVIYQYVEDSTYFGAAIRHFSGEQFIALNTLHPLRIRYFTAAHELWHLEEASQLQDEDFDHERAADRFAAAIMLPKAIIKEVWSKLSNLYEPMEAIIHLADMAATPYEAVVRRLKELKLTVKSIKLTEDEWQLERKRLNLPDSPLDMPQPLTRFIAYEDVVEEALSNGKIDLLSASNKLAKYIPQQTEIWQMQAIEQMRAANKHEA